MPISMDPQVSPFEYLGVALSILNLSRQVMWIDNTQRCHLYPGVCNTYPGGRRCVCNTYPGDVCATPRQAAGDVQGNT